MLTEVLIRKLKGVERRVAFAVGQSSGVIASELTEALKEIKAVLDAVQPDTVSTDEGDAVMFVDDEEIIRRIGTQILEKQGYRVLIACDGIEALEVYRQNSDSIICVILDLVMPRMDGMQTFRQLRRSSPELGIILTTGYGEEEIRKRFGGLKLQGLLRKPFSAGSLLKMVGETIGNSRGEG
ncbi:MAG: response regulator [Candidatus Fermentibacteraceae bacterium]|nr:response regulator [Candidatus Fermentibacteraceae bacterium]